MGAHTKAKLVHLLYTKVVTVSQVAVLARLDDHPDHQGIPDWRQVLLRKLFGDRAVEMLNILVTAFSAAFNVCNGELFRWSAWNREAQKPMCSP